MVLTVNSTYFHTENTVRNITKFDKIEQFELSKKAAVVANFCLIGKILHNVLVPKMIESACKTLNAYSDLRFKEGFSIKFFGLL